MRNVKKSLFLGGLFIVFLLTGCGTEPKEKKTEPPKPTIVYVEKDNKTEEKESEKNKTKKEEVISSVENGEILFETEYVVEDYQQGKFIVSKNDGLLYGVLGMRGEEVIPVKYDDINFMNVENIEKGIGGSVLFLAKFEDKYIIFDASGNELLRTNYAVSTIQYDARSVKMSACGCFWIKDTDKKNINVYDEKANIIAEISYEGYQEARLEFVSPDCCILDLYNVQAEDYTHITVNFDGTILLDGQFEIVETSSMTSSSILRKKDSELFLCYLSGEEYKCWVIDSDATVHERKNFESQEECSADIQRNYDFRINYEDMILGEAHLYTSNNTWKLEDAEGRPLYDERYYACLPESGSYFLMNEDNGLCVVNNKGKMVIEFGRLVKTESDVYFDGTRLTTDNYLVGDDGIVITKWNGEKYSVYYFFNEEHRKEIIANRENYSIEKKERVSVDIDVDLFEEELIAKGEKERRNLLKCADFESSEYAVWEYYMNFYDAFDGENGKKIKLDGGSPVEVFYDSEADNGGNTSLRFWREGEGVWCQQLVLEEVEDGVYEARAMVWGENQENPPLVYLYVSIDGDMIRSDSAQDMKVELHDIEIENAQEVIVGVFLADGCGRIDDFYFGLQE